jgi:hypothetical protein
VAHPAHRSGDEHDQGLREIHVQVGDLDQHGQQREVDRQRREIDRLEPPQVCQHVTADPEDHEPVEHEGDQHADDVRAGQRRQVAPSLAHGHLEPGEREVSDGGVDRPDGQERDALVPDDVQQPARRSRHADRRHHLRTHHGSSGYDGSKHRLP